VRELVNAYLAPLVRGLDARDVERVWARCWWELHSLGSAGLTRLAVATIDIALWDLLAQQAGLPLYRLLGGARDRIAAYASGINAHLDAGGLREQMRGFLDRGYRAVKMKVGRDDPAEDVERVAAVRDAVGPGVEVMLDANQKWTPAEAVRRARRLRRFDPAWLEEPVLADDREGHVRVRREAGVPLAAGETLSTRYEFADFLRAGALDVVQADVVRTGGFTEWLKVARLAEGFNRPVAPHFVLELSVHALCAVPNGMILEDLQGGSLTDLGLLAEPIRVERGALAPPARPGHGVVFDERALARHEVTGKVEGVTPTRGER
jgi:L-alanine-DL-glutamate epimerase-like enolase superfamily enzyme